jgi:Mg2+ and Co2+ transporter CorA
VFKRYYELTDKGICHIKGFCYLIPQLYFEDIILHGTRHKYYDVEDEKFKVLKNFFAQDNSDIVTLISPREDSNRYLDFIFCVTESMYEKLLNRKGAKK